MDDGVAFIVLVGGVLAFSALVLFTTDCIENRQRRNEQEDVAVAGAAVVAAVGVAAIALSMLDRASVPRKNEGGGSTTAAEKPECAFCLGELEDGEEWVVLTRCHHEFHRKCLAKWFANKKTTCPICRAVVWPDVMGETPPLADMV